MKLKEMDCYDKMFIHYYYIRHIHSLNNESIILMNGIGKDMQRKHTFYTKWSKQILVF